MTAYYNEWEPYPAQWLRNLIAANLISPGEVDERSIKDIHAEDIKGFTQSHFFAGIGGWSLALRQAGWPDDRPVWTGSCPCQPFSVAGRGKAQSDERHLWPAWFGLIRECKPSVIFGEQVSGAITHGWLDDVYKGLEAEGYAVGSAVLPACGVGAPHKRDRLWFVADARYGSIGSRGIPGFGENKGTMEEGASGKIITTSSPMGNAKHDGSSTPAFARVTGATGDNDPQGAYATSQPSGTGRLGSVSHVADANNAGSQGWHSGELQERPGECTARPSSASIMADPDGGVGQRSGAQCDVGGFQETVLRESRNPYHWHVEPPLGRVANGIPARSHKLRAYGNAIVPQVAAEFITAFMECRP